MMQSQMQLDKSNSTDFFIFVKLCGYKTSQKDELSTSAFQHWVVEATEGTAHAMQQLHSCLVLYLCLVQRDKDLEVL